MLAHGERVKTYTIGGVLHDVAKPNEHVFHIAEASDGIFHGGFLVLPALDVNIPSPRLWDDQQSRMCCTSRIAVTTVLKTATLPDALGIQYS